MIMMSWLFQLHTSELNDGYEWGRLNLQSITEQSTLEDFLATAELAGTEFQVRSSPCALFPLSQPSSEQRSGSAAMSDNRSILA